MKPSASRKKATADKLKIIVELFFNYISDFIDEARYIITDYPKLEGSIRIGDCLPYGNDKKQVYIVTDVIRAKNHYILTGQIEEAPTLNIGGIEYPL
ncbi:MAG: hypothetical protein ACYTFW_03770, partial [Planctomycetota bacterium]